MKSSLTSVPELYAHWVTTWWSAFESMLPKELVKDLPAKPAQVAAEQKWESEGGALKAVTSPSAGATRAQA